MQKHTLIDVLLDSKHASGSLDAPWEREPLISFVLQYLCHNQFAFYFRKWKHYIDIVGTPLPPLLNGGIGPSKNRVTCGWGLQNLLLERGEKPEKGVWYRNGEDCHFFYYFIVQSYLLFVRRKVRFPLDFHTSLYCPKTWYHLCISDTFW